MSIAMIHIASQVEHITMKLGNVVGICYTRNPNRVILEKNIVNSVCEEHDNSWHRFMKLWRGGSHRVPPPSLILPIEQRKLRREKKRNGGNERFRAGELEREKEITREKGWTREWTSAEQGEMEGEVDDNGSYLRFGVFSS